MQTEGNKLLSGISPHLPPTVQHTRRKLVFTVRLQVICCPGLYFFMYKAVSRVSSRIGMVSVLECWARSSGCQDLSHICAVTQSFLSAACLCLRGASHELSNEVLTITFLSRCCLWFHGNWEMHHIWYELHAENFAGGSSSSSNV